LPVIRTRQPSFGPHFKDFDGGQLYLEHAGSPSRLASRSVRTLIIDELAKFVAAVRSGEDPIEMLEGRTSAFPATYKILYISSGGIKGLSRIGDLYDDSDRRLYDVPCPHCDHLQPLEWAGLQWNRAQTAVWYLCRQCAAAIDEHHKTQMIHDGLRKSQVMYRAWQAETPT